MKLDEAVFYDSIVIGTGPAGVSAAIYLARKGLKVGLIGEFVGGQLLETNDIENIIGIKKTNGFEFSMSLENHLNEYEVDFHKGYRVNKIIRKANTYDILTNDNLKINTKTVILATGTKWKKLNVLGEDKYVGKGVHYCATCDGPFYKNKEVVVVGGGNSGVEAAIDLSSIAKKVTLVEYLDNLNADKVLQEKISSLENVDILLSTKVNEISGGEFVENIVLENLKDNEVNNLKIDGIFVEIGKLANSDLVSEIIKLNETGEIIINEDNMTSLEGIFAAGDCTNVKFKQVIIALGEGAKAALAAFEYIIKRF